MKTFELWQVWFFGKHMVLNPEKCHLITNKDIANEFLN